MTVIKLKTQKRNISIRHTSPRIKLKHLTPRIVLKQVGHPGKTGDQGPQGEPGVGLPPGGNDNDLLQKAGSVDYEYQWVNPNEVADKHYSQEFTVADVITVTHNLNKYPAVQVMDSAGDEVEGEVFYTNTNQVVIRFAYPFSGTVTCN